MSTSELLRELSPTISVGILTADLAAFGSEVALLEQTDVRLLHFDVMDGCFTPTMTLGPPLIQSVSTSLLKDVHLMIQDPLEKVEAYVAAGADIITAHVESCTHIHRVLQRLGQLSNVNDESRGLVRGIALNPGTPLATLEPLMDEVDLIMLLAINPGWGGQGFIPATYRRIEQLRRMVAESERDIVLCVDGGIKRDNVADVVRAGVDLVVTGSAVFDGRNPVENARLMLDTVKGFAKGLSGNNRPLDRPLEDRSNPISS